MNGFDDDRLQEMEAEGQLLREEEVVDQLVEFADRLRRKGLPKTEIHATLTRKKKPDDMTAQKYRQLVREAMGYL